MQNNYASLAVDTDANAKPVKPDATWCITESRADETIKITTAKLPNGLWVYGFEVYWAKGHTSIREPCANHGMFQTEREAELHCIGFLRNYLKHYQIATCFYIRAAEHKLLQGSLFD